MAAFPSLSLSWNLKARLAPLGQPYLLGIGVSSTRDSTLAEFCGPNSFLEAQHFALSKGIGQLLVRLGGTTCHLDRAIMF